MTGILNRQIGGMNILEICLALAVITMPFDYLWNSYAIAIFSCIALLSTGLSKKILYLRRNKLLWILPAAYFVWTAITLLWDKEARHSLCVEEGLESGISWIVFPVIFASIQRIESGPIKKILFSFVLANLAGSVYCLWKAYLEYKSTTYITVFFYHHLSNHIGINAIYFSMYCVFSIYILIFYLFFKNQNIWLRFFSLVSIGYLSVFVILLSSKTFIFLLYLSALALIIYFFYYLKSKLGAAIMFVLLIAIPFLLIKFPYVNSRVSDMQLKEYRGPEDNQNGLAVRGLLWESSWHLIRLQPVFGLGHYTGQDVLQNSYVQLDFAEGVKGNYNSHNQYLYTWLCYGLIGLLLLLFYFGKLLVLFFQNKQLLGISIVLLFVFANITECMLEVQKGIVFFLLFTNLFLFHWTRRSSPKKQG